ncbi:uncharacterized protein V1510DRAFT_369936 [Dipodascopsis tothii]|uniref:uncharacterized protein n=1 Tax=Dipodascopsis tothii TaxID=44089 RepID=UPI0034CDAE7C
MRPRPLLHRPGRQVHAALDALRAAGLYDRLVDWYIDTMRDHFVTHALPVIHGSLRADAGADAAAETERVLNTFGDVLKHYQYPLDELALGAEQALRFRLAFQAIVNISLADARFAALFRAFFEQQLAEWRAHDAGLAGGERALEQRLVRLGPLIEQLGIHDWVDRVVADVFLGFVREYVSAEFEGCWAEPQLPALRAYVYGPLSEHIGLAVRKNEAFRDKLYDVAVEAFARLRMREMFDIVVDYPDSTAALEDVRAVAVTAGRRAALVAAFQDACAARLLHSGANTTDIISVYIAAIKSFKIVDPRGVLLDRVSRPIRRYLRDRPDTVRCLVHGMLADDDDAELAELGAELAAADKATAVADDAHDDDDAADMAWTPDPVDAAPDFQPHRALDLIGSFISMFDNKQVFIDEVVVIFANRLLALHNYDVDRELTNLELLKFRFGESELHNCDVMVRDIFESRRADANIHELAAGSGRRRDPTRAVDPAFHASMLSRLFWPAFKTDDLALPPAVERQLELYAARFSVLKSPRRLQWLRRLGTVDLTLELEDRTLSFVVTPERAALIYLFEERPTLPLATIAERLRIDPADARRGAAFWIQQGVLKEDDTRDVYVLLERAEETAARKVLIDDTAKSAIETGEEKATREMRIYWSYIVGMLTNLRSMPLDRIQSFLKVVVPREIQYTRTEDDLREFLAVMIAEEKVDYVGGQYRLRK